MILKYMLTNIFSYFSIQNVVKNVFVISPRNIITMVNNRNARSLPLCKIRKKHWNIQEVFDFFM